MTPQFAKAVDPVILYVLTLLERIGQGEDPNPSEEQTRIIAMLDVAGSIVGHGEEWDLARYALVSWMDEVLVEAPWGRELTLDDIGQSGRVAHESSEYWNNNALEVKFYNSRLCHDQFYVRAQRATTLERRDALEVFYLCVILGFRGLYRDPENAEMFANMHSLPATLDAWTKQTVMAIRVGQDRPPIRDSGTPGQGAPPLGGMSFMLGSLAAGVVLSAVALIIFIIVFGSR